MKPTPESTTPSPSSRPSSTSSSPKPSEDGVDPQKQLERLVAAAERLDSKFDELILAVRLLVRSR